MALKAFTREEIWLMPFWNGRCFSLQAEGVPVDIVYPKGSFRSATGSRSSRARSSSGRHSSSSTSRWIPNTRSR